LKNLHCRYVKALGVADIERDAGVTVRGRARAMKAMARFARHRIVIRLGRKSRA